VQLGIGVPGKLLVSGGSDRLLFAPAILALAYSSCDFDVAVPIRQNYFLTHWKTWILSSWRKPILELIFALLMGTARLAEFCCEL